MIFDLKSYLLENDLKLANYEIAYPEPKTTYVEIPGSSVVIDLTETLTGKVEYKQRKITIELVILYNNLNEYEEIKRKIMRDLHGKKVQLVMPYEDDFYYNGRFSVSFGTNNKTFDVITLTGDFDPYKYVDIELSKSISGTTEFKLLGYDNAPIPTFYSDATMTVIFNGNSYALVKETATKFVDIVLDSGENILVINGTGTLDITYKGGIL